MRKIVSLLVMLVAALALAVPASAIQFGHPDGNAHPQVGLIVFYTATGAPRNFCTGTLVSSRHVLTAAHCTIGAASAQVWFTPAPTPGFPFFGGIPGTPHTKAGFDWFASLPASHDLGMVVFNDAVPGVAPASLPTPGLLDGLKKGSHTSFDMVGYGLQDVRLPPLFIRFAGEARMVNLNNQLTNGYNVQLTGAPGTGGAACRGDSGGPVFLSGTTTIVAVQSLGRDHCVGGSVAYRIDTADSLTFINSFGP